MLSLNDKEIKRQIILDHYENPRNKRNVNDDRYLTVRMNSESCIDDFNIQILIENNVIKDFCFDGVGCAISTASTSILSELVINKTIPEALEIIDNYDEIRLITVPEIENIVNDKIDSTTFLTSLQNENISWLTTGNYWTATPNSNNANFAWAVSVGETGVTLQEFENTSEYFGIRPVVVIDKDILQ